MCRGPRIIFAKLWIGPKLFLNPRRYSLREFLGLYGTMKCHWRTPLSVIHTPNLTLVKSLSCGLHRALSSRRASRAGPAFALSASLSSAYPTCQNPPRRLHSYGARNVPGSVLRSLRHLPFINYSSCAHGLLPKRTLLHGPSPCRRFSGWGTPRFLVLAGAAGSMPPTYPSASRQGPK